MQAAASSTLLSQWLDSSAGVLCAAGKPPGTPVGGRLRELGDGEIERLERLCRHGLVRDGELGDSARLVLGRLGPYATDTLDRILAWGGGTRLWSGREATDGRLDGNVLHWLAGMVSPFFIRMHQGACAAGDACPDWLDEYAGLPGTLEVQWRRLECAGADGHEPNRGGFTPLAILECSPIGAGILSGVGQAALAVPGVARARRRA